MTEQATIDNAIRGALEGMLAGGPEGLLDQVNFKLRKTETQLTETELIDTIVGGGMNAVPRVRTASTLAQWDVADGADWTAETEIRTAERRQQIYQLLEIGADSQDKLSAAFAIYSPKITIIAQDGPWAHWYTPEFQAQHDFYWNAYKGVLQSKNWSGDALATLDFATSNIVSRLANPSAPENYQSKGLVVGHVQSGKTANFTGTIAKAIDSGYRLIIVLTGTIELLRGQTQRRLDMELIGEENILGGRDRNDPAAVKDVDYIGNDDADWKAGKFLKHNVNFKQSHQPSIIRLTTQAKDYRGLRQGIDALDFRRTGELVDKTQPVFAPTNLYGVDARVAIIKKNATSLKNLIRDLKSIHASLGEIPALIIDDEADQASVNTARPGTKDADEERQKRNTINKLITQLLNEMPRSQYIAYTATPFANVFVDPEDTEDIFPKDFIIALEPSPEYMGGRAFHDLVPLEAAEQRDPAISNEAAHVRDLRGETDAEIQNEMQQALDAFVLTGTIKKWRESHDPNVSFRHHTMLVHESVRMTEHAALADELRDVWRSSGYSQAAGLARLRALFESDFVPVTNARNWGPHAQLPADFDALIPFISEVLALVEVDNGDPVVIVNGSKESEYDAMDFQKRPYWRILVGGAKLSRGFTVEGLTISYYRRKAMAADTLMQMGRWFGYRPGYGDLVRLYIARAVTAGSKTYDLYDAFTSIVQDEEDFREQLSIYSELDEENQPQVLPRDVPPMVFQQLPWLKPTSANKMYNAELDYQGVGGKLQDFAMQAARDQGQHNTKHFDAVKHWLSDLSEPVKFEYVDSATEKVNSFNARYSVRTAADVLDALAQFEWSDGYAFKPTLSSMQKFMSSGMLTEWVVVVPELAGGAIRAVDGINVQVMKRSRRTDRAGFSGSSFRQRGAIERIAGNTAAHGGPNAESLSTPTRGAILLTFAADTGGVSDPQVLPPAVDPSNIATLFSLAMPFKAAPRGRIGFRVKNLAQSSSPIIDKT
ncbi:MAG: Z1 domain-containing protein [Microbacteriaceae bacterium]